MASRLRGAAAVATLGLLVMVPLSAAQEEFAPTAIEVRSLEGVRLVSPGVNQLVRVVAVLTYEGDNSTSQGPIQVRLTIQPPSGPSTEAPTASVVPNRTAGGTTEAAFDWRPAVTGVHNLLVEVPAAQLTANRTVTVTQDAVEAKDLADRIMGYWYVVALFVASASLFVAVAYQRRHA